MKIYLLVLSTAVFLGLYSCQDEQNTAVTTPGNLTQSSVLTALISRVTQYSTANDNVLDNTDCFAVLLPVSLTVNGVLVNVNDQNDYQNVENIINQYANDDDIIHFTFPIRLKYKDFHEVQVNNQEQYQSLFDACAPNNVFTAIECIDFNFPIAVNSYNSAAQTPNTFTFENSTQLYNFIQSLGSDLIFNFVYPLSMTKSNGQTVAFNSNSELQTGIENVIGSCNNTVSQPTLSSVLTNGTWYISSFIDGSDNETYHFNGYNFTFQSDGAVIAIKNATTTNGTWSQYTDSGFSKLDLNFPGESLEELSDDWRVIEYSNTLVKLSHLSGGNGESHYLNFTKN